MERMTGSVGSRPASWKWLICGLLLFASAINYMDRQTLSNAAVPDVNYTDIWWGGSSESGWGIAATQQGSTVFLAWYVYDSNAKPTWYVALCTISGTSSRRWYSSCVRRRTACVRAV